MNPDENKTRAKLDILNALIKALDLKFVVHITYDSGPSTLAEVEGFYPGFYQNGDFIEIELKETLGKYPDYRY